MARTTSGCAACRAVQLELPIYLVIRLTTDEDDTIEYYNSIDNEVEVSRGLQLQSPWIIPTAAVS